MCRFPGPVIAAADTCKPNPIGGVAWLFGLLLWCAVPAASADPLLHHDLQVHVDAAAGRLEVVDRVRIPAQAATGDRHGLRFILADTFEPRVEGAAVRPLDPPLDHGAGARFRAYRLTVAQLPAEITLRYAGALPDGLTRGEHGMPTAVLGPDGVFLDNASVWYPRFGAAPFTFRLTVDLPDGWTAISQGARTPREHGVRWEAQTPQADIYLLAGPYHRYAESQGAHQLEVYLLQDDPQLATRYLQVLGQYLDFYGALIGDYPYPKFAVVENRWQTGYGMPSFTLLGSRVLRLPFILHSSLPHEVLHNWWGNGVYVDLAGGNWSEGLTAYLADHLIKEAQGRGAEYRRRSLERYADFAAAGRDLALRAFRSRHDDASQAVGYGKSLMLFHMLRRELGDAGFIAVLREFWQRYRFREAGFDQLRAVAQEVAEKPVQALAPIWLERPGAPVLRLDAVQVSQGPVAGTYALTVTARQTQQGAVYPLRVPVVVQLADGRTLRRDLSMSGRSATLEMTLEARPARVDLDPDFDLFRLLGPNERPATLARLFGATQQWLVLPSDAAAGLRQAWEQLATAWAGRYDNVKVVTDRDLQRLPDDAAVWLLGLDNRWLPRVRDRLRAPGQSLADDGFHVGDKVYDGAEYLAVLLDPETGRSPLGVITANGPEQVLGLARKLPHYGSAGRLVFRAGTLENLVRDDLPLTQSPLARVLGADDPGPPVMPTDRLVDRVPVPLRFE